MRLTEQQCRFGMPSTAGEGSRKLPEEVTSVLLVRVGTPVNGQDVVVETAAKRGAAGSDAWVGSRLGHRKLHASVTAASQLRGKRKPVCGRGTKGEL